MCKNRDFALYGLWRPYKATKSYFFGIINVWGSSLGSRRNLHIGFIMGCRGDFCSKMQKTTGGVSKCPPPPVNEGLRNAANVLLFGDSYLNTLKGLHVNP